MLGGRGVTGKGGLSGPVTRSSQSQVCIRAAGYSLVVVLRAHSLRYRCICVEAGEGEWVTG